MNVKSLLVLADKCTTKKQVEHVLGDFVGAFTQHFDKRLSHLRVANQDACLEGQKKNRPYLRFEANYLVSDEYVICGLIAIRDGALAVYVVCNRMHDKHGMESRHWTPLDDDGRELSFDEETKVSYIVKGLVDEFIQQHALLIESVGIEKHDAEKLAKEQWKRRARTSLESKR